MKHAIRVALVLFAAGSALAGCAPSSTSSAAHSTGGAAVAAAAEPNHAVAPAASCKVSITVANLQINSTFTYSVKATWKPCGGVTYASWNMMQGQRWIGYWSFPPSAQYTSFYPGYHPLGTYRAVPTGANDRNFNYLAQNTYQFYIRVNSRISVSGYRSGKFVFVRARVTRYDPSRNYGSGGWVNSPSRKVSFFQFSGGRWRSFAAKNTSSNGYTGYAKIRAPTRRKFRALVQANATMWNRQSTPITR